MKLIDNKLQSFQVAGRIPQWIAWLIAGLLFVLAWFGVGYWARTFALNEISLTEDEWTSDGILVQETSYTCVPSSIVMLLSGRGVETNTLEVATLAGTDFFGTGSGGIFKAGRYFGFSVERKYISFNELFDLDSEVLVLFRRNGERHAATIKPVRELGVVDVRDPVQGRLYFTEEDANNYFGSEKWECYIFENADD